MVTRFELHITRLKTGITYQQKRTAIHMTIYPGPMNLLENTPDKETVKQIFNDIFGTQGNDFYEKPMAYFEQLLKERFSLSEEELSALPVC